MQLFEIRSELPASRADEGENLLLELGLEGWTLQEDAVAKRAWVVGLFPSRAEAQERFAELRAAGPELGWSGPEVRAVADSDWKESYKAHFHAWKFGRLHWVPIWQREEFRLPPGEAVLWLDPGMAFGTGNHETTRLVVERLMAHAAAFGTGGSVIDAGCGSGILALSAAKMGFARVAAFDNDPLAVEVSQGNAVLNGLAREVDFYVGDLVSGLSGRQGALVMANIQADVLMAFAAPLLAAVAPGGELVLSGILVQELDQVRERFLSSARGWVATSQSLGEWADLALTRSA